MEAHPIRLDTSAADALLKKSAGIPPLTFVGLPGSTETADHIRLYQDSELISYIEIPSEAVLDTRQDPDGELALVRVRRDTRLRVGAVAAVNAEVLFSFVEPPSPPEVIPLDEPNPPKPGLHTQRSATLCSMSVRMRLEFRKVWGPEGIMLVPVLIPVYVMDCR